MKKVIVSVATVVIRVCALQAGTVTAEKFKRRGARQIRSTLAGMELSDRVQWRYTFDARGILSNYSTGHKRSGKWWVFRDELVCTSKKNLRTVTRSGCLDRKSSCEMNTPICRSVEHLSAQQTPIT